MNYFPDSEMACPCCGRCDMDIDFMERLNLARHDANLPFVINSGFRCEKHNKEVGSTSANHTDGKAADIKCGIGFYRVVIVKSLLKYFSRIGLHKEFIHVDSTDNISSMWLY